MSNPLTLLAPNTKGIVVNAMDIVRKESMKTSKFFDGMADDKGTASAFKPALKECASDFKMASGTMSLKVLEGDFATMDNWKNFYDVANAAAQALENLQKATYISTKNGRSIISGYLWASSGFWLYISPWLLHLLDHADYHNPTFGTLAGTVAIAYWIKASINCTWILDRPRKTSSSLLRNDKQENEQS
ncbi:unnamed protein product [Dovyalis caffra]|uniref:Uncharacterized protein n=1 Tax=Dovyalis caffra TaxID=77055 RepID=A0AAV1S5Q5_9ROSI|nr:unnamed protein product [Dovyalis caffra]